MNALGDIKGADFLQSSKDIAEYAERALAYHYRLSLLLRGFNHAELDKLFTTSHPFFYGSLDLDGKVDVREAFDSAYHKVESILIERLTEEAERWLRTPAGSAYYDGYHLSTYVFSSGFVPHLLIEQMD